MKNLILLWICLLLAIPSQAGIIYVDANAPGNDNGSSWADAYNYLQDALTDANSSPKPIEIRVAQGIYTPDTNLADPNGSGDRDATFQLINDVILKGGYAGFGQPDTNERDIEAYETILSGDLDSNDVDFNATWSLRNEPTMAENSYHVVKGSGTDESAILDGFIITGGNAYGELDWRDPRLRGGGIYCNLGSRPVITNCTITRNFADWLGGGIYGCDGPIINCIISYNKAVRSGGGLIVCDGPISNCYIYGNITHSGGGGLYNCDGPIRNCRISGNRANYAGAATDCGGHMINCTITDNWAYEETGGLRQLSGSITNCIIWGNSPPQLLRCVIPNYSCFPDSTQIGTGNIDCDPCFISSGYWGDCNNPSIIVEPNDPNAVWINGNYHLHPNSCCINRGNYLYSMTLPSNDLDKGTRLVGTQIDMGCYETDSSTDIDGDWLSDVCEPSYADEPDRDNDGILDGVEILRGSDPNIFDPLGQWNVPDDVNSIQEALFFSRSGEIITIQQGTYHENIHIGGRDIILTSTEPNNHDIVAATIISGDTDANPLTINARPVTFAGAETEKCIISGLTITGGYDKYGGGGIDGHGTLASIRACIIIENRAVSGGGIHHFNGSITECTIQANTSSYIGGGLSFCNGKINKCTIRNNSAGSYGGGMRNGQTSPLITNCIFAANSAGKKGGGIYNEMMSNVTLTNCTFAGNLAPDGNAVACDSLRQLHPSNVQLTNCILWDGGNEIWNNDNSIIAITYSDVQGGWPGEGNIDADPCFAEPGYWDANGTPQDANDDFWVDGDYHLQSAAGRWDPNQNDWVYDANTNPCIDAGNPGCPLGNELNDVNNIRINMGAHGGTAEASKTPAGWSLLADLSNDGTVDWQDFAYTASDWCATADEQPGDLDRNGVVDLADLALFVDDWLKQTTWHE